MRETPPPLPAPAYVPTWQPVVLWIPASTIGAATAAWHGVQWFPRARIAGPAGHPDLDNVLFALVLGLGIALPQAAVLYYLARRLRVSRRPLLLLWVPVVSVGIMTMLLPIYYVEATSLGNPAFLVPMMLAGVLLLGVGQWFLLSRMFSTPSLWILRTALGTLLGAIFGAGLVAGFSVPFSSRPEPGILEACWAFVTGLCMGVAQAGLLPSSRRRPGRRS